MSDIVNDLSVCLTSCMEAPRSKTLRPKHRLPMIGLVKLCVLVFGLPTLFSILLDSGGGIIAGLITLAAGVFFSVAFTMQLPHTAPQAEFKVESG